MPAVSSHEQTGIQVSVTPSQSAFFAGETFAVSITFTNTRRISSARPQPRSASAAQSHRRGVHSVSSVPLARPPTSPGSPKTANASTSSFPIPEDASRRKRRGLVGQHGLQNPRISAVAAEEGFSVRKKRSSPKSLSVSITPDELMERLIGKSTRSTPPSPEFADEAVALTDRTGVVMSSTPSTPSRSRDAKLPIHPSHPHARKQSVQDFQAQEVSTPFALSLDPIAEHSIVTPITPFAASPLPSSSSVIESNTRHPRTDVHAGHSRRSSVAASATDIGLGRPSTLSPPGPRQPRSAFSSTFSPPGTEALLWAYVQLVGTVELDESVVAFNVIERLKEQLLFSGAIGRGSMDIGSSPSPSTSFLTSFLPQRSPRSPLMRHQRASPSLLSSLPSFGLSTLFSPARLSPFASPGLNRTEEGSLPTLDLQPNVLAVDLTLTPGESRTYTYTLSLPVLLPPTFRGKAIRFSYELVVGTSHAPSPGNNGSSSPLYQEQHRKKVMKIPIRVYNSVSVQHPLSIYDLLWPARKDKSARQGRVDEDVLVNQKPREVRPSSERRPSAAVYAKQLVQSVVKSEHVSVTEEEEEVWSCREAVEILTRNSRKVSYDISKDGEQVAVLTLVKSSYRVGETISGVVELNERSSFARVLKFSAFLEAHEQLPASFTENRNPDLRRVHAEHHSSLTPNALRLPFSLDVPSDASPAFRFSAGEVARGEGGLQWRVRICFLVTAGSGPSRHLVRDGYEDDWGVAWRASLTLAPLVSKTSPSPSSVPSTPVPGGWNMPKQPASDDAVHAVDDQDWGEAKTETVECEIPLAIWPGNTLFRPMETSFGA
ncbi:Rgp1-domain-containing protein [Calocera cornea HHB12733]|uniref:Rgp1-domain-containing protein n=1 Tax=Calocera cornea HHB12733 TaxID=1353952 RepID=A0A165GVP2_9BASI|nr:Rgp1-domain-containing protein [Calocera cornea HHB12733]